jgi:hypothetical protein
MQARVAPALQGEGFVCQPVACGYGARRDNSRHRQRRQRGQARFVHAHGFGRTRRIVDGRARQPLSKRHLVRDEQVGFQLGNALGNACPRGAIGGQIHRPFHHADPHTFSWMRGAPGIGHGQATS